jgi:hypothetical protein
VKSASTSSPVAMENIGTVGCESSPQFSRKYARKFGLPPRQDRSVHAAKSSSVICHSIWTPVAYREDNKFKRSSYKKTNDLWGRGRWISVPSAPPPTLTETDYGSLRSPFFFWFQRGLVEATALRRLGKCPKSVSERHLSLTDRPSVLKGRFQKISQFQCFGVFGRVPFSKERPIPQFNTSPKDG